MPTHVEALESKIDQELSIGDFSVILLNATEALTISTDPAVILSYEPIQVNLGYAPVAYSYTAGDSEYNAVTGWQEAATFAATFSAAPSSPYSYSHVGFWQGRGNRANRLVDGVSAVDNTLTVADHGLVNGDRVVVTSTGTAPGGIGLTRYWAKVLDIDTIELYSNPDLLIANRIDILNEGSGSHYLRYANGSLYYWDSLNGTINPGSPRTIQVVYRIR